MRGDQARRDSCFGGYFDGFPSLIKRGTRISMPVSSSRLGRCGGGVADGRLVYYGNAVQWGLFAIRLGSFVPVHGLRFFHEKVRHPIICWKVVSLEASDA